jgi:hypothetical protein
MNAKTVLITFLSFTALILFVFAISFFVWKNQPSADIASPPVPPAPEVAQGKEPPVPPAVRLRGDTIDDGWVDILDINALIVHWKEKYPDYDLAQATKEEDGILNTLDLAQVIKYWKCLEGKSGCEYQD